jgi:hypothetical protein
MSLEDEFNESRVEWKNHIKRVSYSSNPNVYVNCEAYKKLVSMGSEILPYIKKDLEEPVESSDMGRIGLFWLHAMHDLFGERFSIPEEIRYKDKELIEYTLKWIDEYQPK